MRTSNKHCTINSFTKFKKIKCLIYVHVKHLNQPNLDKHSSGCKTEAPAVSIKKQKSKSICQSQSSLIDQKILTDKITACKIKMSTANDSVFHKVNPYATYKWQSKISVHWDPLFALKILVFFFLSSLVTVYR